MADFSKKIKSNIFICAVALSFGADPKPSIIDGWQRIYNTIFDNEDFQKIYTGLSSIEFSEESVDSDAGTSYKQKVSFRFPITDDTRSEKIHILRKIKFVELQLTNGLVIVVGRNDAFQNKRPKVDIKTNERTIEVNVTANSAFPSGFTPNATAFGLPNYVPLNF